MISVRLNNWRRTIYIMSAELCFKSDVSNCKLTLKIITLFYETVSKHWTKCRVFKRQTVQKVVATESKCFRSLYIRFTTVYITKKYKMRKHHVTIMKHSLHWNVSFSHVISQFLWRLINHALLIVLHYTLAFLVSLSGSPLAFGSALPLSWYSSPAP